LFLAMFVPSELPQSGSPGMQLLGTLRHEVRTGLQPRSQLVNLGSETPCDRRDVSGQRPGTPHLGLSLPDRRAILFEHSHRRPVSVSRRGGSGAQVEPPRVSACR
jgi:hypothetical protein